MLTPGILMGDAVARAAQLVQEIPGAILLDQFSNPANAEVHCRTTAVEPEASGEGPPRRPTQ